MTACGNPLGPTELVQPRLASLSASPRWREGGIFSDTTNLEHFIPGEAILAVGSRLADSTARLGANERIAIQVIVSSGDSEQLLLESEFDFPGPIVRTNVAVMMRSPHTVDELDDVVAQIPARWWLVCPGRTCGSFRVFDSRRVAAAMRDLRADHRVLAVQHDAIAFPGGDGPIPNLRPVLFAAAPMDHGPARPGDGIVQGQKGDLIEVRYSQPDGTVLIDSIVMQGGPSGSVSK